MTYTRADMLATAGAGHVSLKGACTLLSPYQRGPRYEAFVKDLDLRMTEQGKVSNERLVDKERGLVLAKVHPLNFQRMHSFAPE